MPFAGSAGNRIESGASDLDSAAEDASPRLSGADGGRQRRPAASGGGTRRRAQSWAPGHRLKRGRHLCAARRAAKPMGTTAAAEKRRSGGTTRRRGHELRRDHLGRRRCTRSKQKAQDGSLHLAQLLDGTRRRAGDGGGEIESGGG
jgi:hypothetical protein